MKLPFLQFFPADYMRDTRVLSLAAKGGWVDILCMLHGASIRGSMELPIVGWARLMGATVDQAEAVISELEVMSIADVTRCNGNVTLTSRRMVREYISRNQNKMRVARHRDNAACNGIGNDNVTVNKSEGISQSKEDSLRSSSIAEPLAAHAPNDLPVCVFQTVGDVTSWTLYESKLAEYKPLYPGLEVRAEALRARQWCIDNPAKRKTARGMPKFLNGWLERSQNSGRGSLFGQSQPQQPTRIPPNIAAMMAEKNPA